MLPRYCAGHSFSSARRTSVTIANGTRQGCSRSRCSGKPEAFHRAQTSWRSSTGAAAAASRRPGPAHREAVLPLCCIMDSVQSLPSAQKSSDLASQHHSWKAKAAAALAQLGADTHSLYKLCRVVPHGGAGRSCSQAHAATTTPSLCMLLCHASVACAAAYICGVGGGW